MREQVAKALCVGGRVAGDTEAVRPGRAVANEDAVEAAVFVRLCEGLHVLAVNGAADDGNVSAA